MEKIVYAIGDSDRNIVSDEKTFSEADRLLQSIDKKRYFIYPIISKKESKWN